MSRWGECGQGKKRAQKKVRCKSAAGIGMIARRVNAKIFESVVTRSTLMGSAVVMQAKKVRETGPIIKWL